MTEYKEFHCPYGDDFEGGDECDRCEQYELCMETPTADVIERSKIDKAIERIKHMPLIATRNRVTIYKSGEDILKEVLDILENIGE